MKNKILFYKTNEPFGFLNNFKKAPMFIYGKWWKNVEAAYQSRKSLSLEDQEVIWKCNTPREARDLGQKISIRPDWCEIRIFVMKECVLAKFTQNKDLLKYLLETGDAELIENSPIDYFWGCGSDKTGQNQLGKILMEVRSELSKSQFSSEDEIDEINRLNKFP